MLFSSWPRLRRLSLACLAVLWPCARVRDAFWGRLLHIPGKMLLSHRSCPSPGCSGTVAVIITVQIGHCRCQHVLIGLSSNKTANVVKLLTWMQLYWYCKAYLVCLCHLPLELSRGALITVALRAGIAVTHGFVPVAEGATWAVAILFLEQGSATPGEGLLWAAVRMWLLGLLVVCHGHLSASSPVPLCLEHPNSSLALGLLVRSTYLLLFSPLWESQSPEGSLWGP